MSDDKKQVKHKEKSESRDQTDKNKINLGGKLENRKSKKSGTIGA